MAYALSWLVFATLKMRHKATVYEKRLQHPVFFGIDYLARAIATVLASQCFHGRRRDEYATGVARQPRHWRPVGLAFVEATAPTAQAIARPSATRGAFRASL
jgi:hypothetical protein